MNTLFYADNLKMLRQYIKDESVDLVGLDPPFNSNRGRVFKQLHRNSLNFMGFEILLQEHPRCGSGSYQRAAPNTRKA